MTLTIVATAGSASANSFATEAEQIAYMAARLNASAWTTLTGTACTETEKAAMIEAARELNTLAWDGRRASETQALAWGRLYVANPDSPNGFDYDSAIVPQRVKNAQMELAFQFLKAGSSDVAAVDPNAGVIEKTVDVLTTRWDVYQRPTQGLRRFPRVLAEIRPLLESADAGARIVRG